MFNIEMTQLGSRRKSAGPRQLSDLSSINSLAVICLLVLPGQGGVGGAASTRWRDIVFRVLVFRSSYKFIFGANRKPEGEIFPFKMISSNNIFFFDIKHLYSNSMGYFTFI